MVYYEEHWKQGQMNPDLTKKGYKVKKPADVRAS